MPLVTSQSVVEGMHADKDPDIVFRSTLYLMDIERIRFALNRYLRTRLKKIESQLDYVVSTPDVVDMLSERERGFAFELHGLNGRYMTETVVERLSAQQAVEGADDMLRHSYPQQQVLYSTYYVAFAGVLN